MILYMAIIIFDIYQALILCQALCYCCVLHNLILIVFPLIHFFFLEEATETLRCFSLGHQQDRGLSTNLTLPKPMLLISPYALWFMHAKYKEKNTVSNIVSNDTGSQVPWVLVIIKYH